MKNFQVNGAVPVNQSQLDSWGQSITQQLQSLFERNMNHGSALVGQGQEVVATTTTDDVDETEFTWWCWGGRIQPVPEDFALEIES